MKPVTIAVAGKGGTGKTTICGMLIEHLSSNGKRPVLAVDADPNSNLNAVLGVDVRTTLSDIREGMLQKETENGSSIPAGMTKQEYAEFMFSNALVERDDFDLLVMGHTQGKGCYCYVNGVLKNQIDKYSGHYRYIVVDNEAGMEHISRGILPQIDILLLISDASRRGIQTVGRIAKMIRDLNIKPRLVKLIVNRAPEGVADQGLIEEIASQKLELLSILPHDEMVYRYDCEGKPSAGVPKNSPIKLGMQNIIGELGI